MVNISRPNFMVMITGERDKYITIRAAHCLSSVKPKIANLNVNYRTLEFEKGETAKFY
jgi:hypothetical protein